MKRSEANIIKKRILDNRHNELTKKMNIKRVFAIIDSMTEPDGLAEEIIKIRCPRCGMLIEMRRTKL